ncbi:DNA polymerase III subunit delta [Thermophagus sp. OGC60D27]|uniref:DNA polymerase III subunit delta n=1 Tax=Thermophagus sp. OGC60D27 TaxID=3458415 RepID=UPI004037F008
MDLKFEEIVAQLKKNDFAKVYFLFGEEPWFADYITDYIVEHALKKEEKDFNLSILYGRDIDAMDIVHAARRYPMMAPRQVVIVKEAQNIKKFDPLISYLKAPAPSTVLVINYRDKFDQRSKVWKEFTPKEFITLETKKLYDNKAAQWITKYLKNKNLDIDPKATLMLVEHLGSDLSKIVKALDKLIVAVGPEVKTITSAHVDEYVGISKDYNTFELQKAIIYGNIVKANQIAHIFGQNPKETPIPAITGLLFIFFRNLLTYHVTPDKSQKNIATLLKIHPYFVKDYQTAARRFNWAKTRQVISLLREYDMRSKGFNNNSASEGELLQEMIFKIMH